MVPKIMNLPKNLAVIDVETSGVNPFNHEILSIGIIPLSDGFKPCKVYIRHINIEWSSYALQNFQKFSSDWDSNALSPVEAVIHIENYLADTFNSEVVTLIGHNIGFDVAFLRKLAFQAGKDQLVGASHRMLDTHTMLYLLFLNGLLPRTALSSDGAFSYFGIKVSEKDRHTALGDAIATRELVIKLFTMFDDVFQKADSSLKCNTVKFR